MSNHDTWLSNIQEEVDFWRMWMTSEKYAHLKDARLKNNKIVSQGIINLLGLSEGSQIKLLDVGSGPISTLGSEHDNFDIQLHPVDPLAEEYNKLLDELNLSQCPRIVKGTGESLKELFTENHFDFVNSANALDHSYNPLLCIQNMVHVCKPSGWVNIVTVQNEGQRQNYQGLHQWNFELQDDCVRLWNLNSDLLLHEHLDNIEQLEAVSVDHGNGLPMIMIKIKKKI
ncbi:MAG: methyltransferase domain-containing protein [Methylococcaceae bacterium]